MEEPAPEAEADQDPVIQTEPIISSFSDRDEKPEVQAFEAPEQPEAPPEPEGEGDIPTAPEIAFTELENKDYQLPSLNLLDDPKHTYQQADKKIFMIMRESLKEHSKASV